MFRVLSQYFFRFVPVNASGPIQFKLLSLLQISSQLDSIEESMEVRRRHLSSLVSTNLSHQNDEGFLHRSL